MADIDLSVSASLANLEAQLAKVRDITADEAKLIVKELQASIRAGEKAAKESAAATKKAMQDTEAAAKKAAAATSDVGDKFGKVGSSAGKVAGVLDLLVPGLGSAARGVADVADGMEVAAQGGDKLAIGLGVVGAAMGAVALATEYYAKQLEEVEERNARLAATASSTVADVKRLEAVEAELVTQYQVATGAISEEEAAIMSRTGAVRDAFAAQEEAARQRLADAEASRDNTEANYAEVQSARAALDAIVERKNRSVEMAIAIETARNIEKKAEDDLRESRERAADAAKRLAEEEARFEAASKARLDLGRLTLDYAAGMEKLQQAAAGQGDEEAKILARGKERLQQLEDLALKTRYLGLTNEKQAAVDAALEKAQVQVKAETQAEIDAIEQAAFEKRMALLEEQRAADQAAAEERAAQAQAAIEQSFGALSGLLEDGATMSAEKVLALQTQLADGNEKLSEEQKQALKKQVEAQRAAAIRAFEINKAAKLAEAVINVAAAVAANAANPVGAGLAAAIGGAQIATIMAQQPAFHSGGMVGGPDQVGARLVAGEGVLSRQGVSSIGGPEAVRAANAGVSQAPVVVAVSQYRHEVFRPFIRDHLRLGGGLADAIRGQRTIGMREAL